MGHHNTQMFARQIESYLHQTQKSHRVVTLVGPRQSGKTTLLKNAFPDAKYATLESPDIRALALNDPRGFLNSDAKTKLHIIDEIQRAPDLLSYIQEIVDQPKNSQRFLLTGSHNLLLMEKVSQSLAGRARLLTLLPMSYRELKQAAVAPKQLDEAMRYGGYPRIYNEKLDPWEWLGDYYQTYVEKDVRALQNISDLGLFERFVELCAGRIGQLCNLNQLGNECGISHTTARKWLSLLETSFVLFLLRPHHKNFNKRIIKTPKLYFYDTGLLCYLLKIRNNEQLRQYPLRGSIFENWVIAEMIKQKFHQGDKPDYYFWRDQKGHEIDLIEDTGQSLLPLEIKSAETFHPDFIKNINYINQLQSQQGGLCVYGGKDGGTFKGVQRIPWHEV